MKSVEVDPVEVKERGVDPQGRVSVGTGYAGETVRVAVIETVSDDGDDVSESDVLDPSGPDWYVWDHSTESVVQTFDRRRAAVARADRGDDMEAVDARPLGTVEEGPDE
jgi:hypothetical protein